jgi:hypothetical protein
VAPGGWLDRWIAGIAPAAGEAVAGTPGFTVVNAVLHASLWGYLILLPLAHAGLYYNFYGRRSLPGAMQRMLERYTNLFGLIIWRVFSVDLVNFFIRVWREPPDGGQRLPVSRLGAWPRFNHVGEMICLTSLFTTLKYYPSNDAIFRERLLRYARTIPRDVRDRVTFEYVSVVRRPTHFDWVTVANYIVDVDAASVNEQLLDESFSPRAAHAASPVHEGTLPGSYAPAGRY